MPPVQQQADYIPANPAAGQASGHALPDLIQWQASALDILLNGATPEEIIAAAQEAVCPGRLAVVSSFGTESGVLLAAAAAVDPTIPVLLIDTGFLFPETLAYRDQLACQLGLTDIRAIAPDAAELAAADAEGNLSMSDPDACCALRKVRPLAKALAGFDGWVNGRKRFQGGDRAAIPTVEAEGPRLKFNPLASVCPEDFAVRFRAAGLPPHPLEKHGFRSIGCMPCTSATRPGEDPRTGRWRGRGKRECGIHLGASLKA
jgi:phosphoadenosine phosphosulfate reductase